MLKLFKIFTREAVDTKGSRDFKKYTVVLGGGSAKVCHKEHFLCHVRKKTQLYWTAISDILLKCFD